MNKPLPPLIQYEKNYTSQFGEDGILERALELLPALDRWCVEFGAWDGKYLSNTYSLIEKHEYSAIMIEADPKNPRRVLTVRGAGYLFAKTQDAE